jgi:hypothetical protein
MSSYLSRHCDHRRRVRLYRHRGHVHGHCPDPVLYLSRPAGDFRADRCLQRTASSLIGRQRSYRLLKKRCSLCDGVSRRAGLPFSHRPQLRCGAQSDSSRPDRWRPESSIPVASPVPRQRPLERAVHRRADFRQSTITPEPARKFPPAGDSVTYPARGYFRNILAITKITIAPKSPPPNKR